LSSDSIPAAFRRAVTAHGGRPAVCLPDRQITYTEVDQASDRVAAGLAMRGVRRGERVGLYCPNGPEFVLAYLGILKTGAIVVPVNLLLSPAEMAYVLGDAGACALLYHHSLGERAAGARQGVPGLRLGVVIGGSAVRDGDCTFASLLASAVFAPRGEGPAGADVAAILYTSGTTGHPKGAQLTHDNLLANAAGVCQVLELRPGQDRVLVVLPMFHAFAATVGVLTPLLHGLALVPVPRFEPGLVMDYIEATGATLFLGVPSMYALFLRLPEDQVARWCSVRCCVCGGAALPMAVLEGFERRFGVPLLEGDGPTECGPVTCVNPLMGLRKPGSVGLPIPGVEMCILDDAGCALSDGEMGEVCVRGPSVMKGYLGHPEADAQAFCGDWFRTGDLGYRDLEGYFFLVDRKKDMLIVNGMNVYPRVVEEALCHHPAVAEVAVVGEPHPLHGEVPVAHVVPREGMTLDPAQLRAWCRDRLGRHEVPRRVLVRGGLPRNAAGKVLKRELRQQGELERGVVAGGDTTARPGPAAAGPSAPAGQGQG
jgi:long-chain acyl-CoA synthetase